MRTWRHLCCYLGIGLSWENIESKWGNFRECDFHRVTLESERKLHIVRAKRERVCWSERVEGEGLVE